MERKKCSVGSRKAESRKLRLESTIGCFLPPPNITGTLHIGHSFNHCLTDVFLRSKAIHRTKRAAWTPGLDHAGIASQVAVQRSLVRCGVVLSYDAGCFAENVWEWYYLLKETARLQCDIIKVSASWERSFFTFSSSVSPLLVEAFARFDGENLIRRTNRLVNWDPSLNTAISDLEVENLSVPKVVWHLRWSLPLSSFLTAVGLVTSKQEPLSVGTSTATHLALLQNQEQLGSSWMVLVKDRIAPQGVQQQSEESKLSTKATASTNQANQKVSSSCGRFSSFLKRGKVREASVSSTISAESATNQLPAGALLLGLKIGGAFLYLQSCKANVPHSNRTAIPVKQTIRRQWFLVLKVPAISNGRPGEPSLSLAQHAVEALRTRVVRFIPTSWVVHGLRWLRSMSDWCLSRQLDWGHKFSSQLLLSGNDVLDTWFSSSVVPLIAAQEFNRYFSQRTTIPFAALFTGYDIVQFWVLRMLMINACFAAHIPFTTVSVHGLFCSKDGTKMSKSRGNVIEPLELVNQPEKSKPNKQEAVGTATDTLRITLATTPPFSKAVVFDWTKLKGSRNFCLKAANAASFVATKLGRTKAVPAKSKGQAGCYILPYQSRWFASELKRLADQLRKCQRRFRFDSFSECILEFVRRKCCDKFVECTKLMPAVSSYGSRITDLNALLEVLLNLLFLLYPVAPTLATTLRTRCAACFNQLKRPVGGNNPTNQKAMSVKSLINAEAEKVADGTIAAARALKETLEGRDWHLVALLVYADQAQFLVTTIGGFKLPEVFVFWVAEELTPFNEHSHKPLAGTPEVLLLPLCQSSSALGKSVDPRKLLSVMFVSHSALLDVLRVTHKLGFLLRSVRY